jgi:hypothetical protein
MRHIGKVCVWTGMAATLAMFSSLAGTGLADEVCEVVPIIKQWSGANSAQDSAKQEIARDVEKWQSLWKMMRGKSIPLPEPPEVDFQKHMVIGVFMGSRPTGGYSVHISRIVKNDKLIVSVRETAPDPGDPVTTALTAPYHVVVVPRSDKPVEFVSEQTQKPLRRAPRQDQIRSPTD